MLSYRYNVKGGGHIKIIFKCLIGFIISILIFAAVLICLFVIAIQTIKKEFNESNTYDMDYVNMWLSDESYNLDNLLKENGLKTGYDIHHNGESNSLEEYQSIKQFLKEENLIIYFNFLGEKETDKICIVLGYKSLDDYLTKNGYLDKQKKTSIRALKVASYIRVTNERKAQHSDK